MNEIKVVELFAGVGGFRLGLEKSSTIFNTIWANQWEPGKKTQHAFDCYTSHFGMSDNHINENINLVKKDIPKHDLLVGGFPCQDYSVARTQAKGMEGKKGVLWWDIYDIAKTKKPKYILLENVDRLLKSPSSQRGRDFGVMLRCLSDLNYIVEWRVINAAEYGFAQRRRRVFIFAYKKATKLYNKVKRQLESESYRLSDIIYEKGFFSQAFPVDKEIISKHKDLSIDISKESYLDLSVVSNKFESKFNNSGIMYSGKAYSIQTTPFYEKPKTLKQIMQKGKIDERFFISENTEKWKYLKGAKKVPRIKPNGEPYFYSEGPMQFPDNLNAPARTILTSETSVNRSTHVIQDYKTKRLRLLTPIECEKINGFDRNWTNTGMPEKFRYFCMGNALVVPVIARCGKRILEIV